MCIEYARTIGVGQFMRLVLETGAVPPIAWIDPSPSPGSAQFHIKIGDEAVIARLEGRHLIGQMMSWGWKDGRQIIFNMKAENCDFSPMMRVLILATGFYEYTEPAEPRIGRRDRHLFTMRGEEWFWIAGIAEHGRFAMLTTCPGPDIKPYHRRQLCVLPPSLGWDWLTLAVPQEDLLKSVPAGTLMVQTLHEAAPVDPERYLLL